MRGEQGKKARKLGMAMVIGGSLSNLYDRYVRGYVVDYFSLRFGPLKEVVFNLGDIFILLGAALQAVCFSLEGGKRGRDPIAAGTLGVKEKKIKRKVAIDKQREIL